LAISKEKKKQMVTDYVERMSNSQALILADYRGLTVGQLGDLRNRLRQNNGQFQVVKNSLFEIALQQAGLPIPTEQLQGTVGVGYCLEEVPPVAKTLTDFAKETNIMAIRGAILGTDLVGPDGVQRLADLPPREVILAQVLGAVQGPMSGLASVLVAPLRELVQVLHARSEQAQDAAA
jgi:large subunit ribosomal protein L10